MNPDERGRCALRGMQCRAFYIFIRRTPYMHFYLLLFYFTRPRHPLLPVSHLYMLEASESCMPSLEDEERVGPLPCK